VIIPARIKRIPSKILSYRSFSVSVILVGMIIGFWAITPEHKFISSPVIDIFLTVSPMITIVTIAMALLLISGEFDLSVGSIYALASAIVAILYTNHGVNPVIAVIIALTLAGVLGGFINGIVVTKLRISSLIATLATMWIYRGATLLITEEGREIPYYPGKMFPTFEKFFCGKILGGLPVQFLWLIVIAILLWILLEHTKFGNWIFATGSNKESARMMGINTDRVKIICFILVGFLAAFAGIIQTTRIHIAAPWTAQTMNLEAIAGAVVGGTLLTGGVGSILGAVLGAFSLRVLSLGLVMMGLSPYVYMVATGVLLILAVAFNELVRRWMSHR